MELEEILGRLQQGERVLHIPRILQRDGDLDWSLKRSGIPPETVDWMRLEHWEPRANVKGLEEATAAIAALIRGNLEFAFHTFAGPPGTGKTHLALAVAWEWLEAGAFVAYYRAQTLMDMLRAKFDLSPQQRWAADELSLEDELQILEHKCHLLIIDDLGSERATEWSDATLERLIDTRWIKRMPLIVTTNVKSSGLPPRIVDRLKDRRMGKVITLVGPSYRSGEEWL